MTHWQPGALFGWWTRRWGFSHFWTHSRRCCASKRSHASPTWRGANSSRPLPSSMFYEPSSRSTTHAHLPRGHSPRPSSPWHRRRRTQRGRDGEKNHAGQKKPLLRRAGRRGDGRHRTPSWHHRGTRTRGNRGDRGNRGRRVRRGRRGRRGKGGNDLRPSHRRRSTSLLRGLSRRRFIDARLKNGAALHAGRDPSAHHKRRRSYSTPLSIPWLRLTGANR